MTTSWNIVITEIGLIIARGAVVKGYEQAISDITMLALGEKMKQGVDVSKATEAIKGIDLSSIVNAINNSKR